MLDVPDYEAEVSEHFDSVHIEGDEPADGYGFHDQQQSEFVNETLQNSSATNNAVGHEQESLPAVEESVEEPKKFTYASIVCVSDITATSYHCVVSFAHICLHLSNSALFKMS